MTQPGDDDLRQRLRRALPAAMKSRDRPAVTALRSALAAIDNAEAVDPARAPPAPSRQDTPGSAPGDPAATGSGPGDPAATGSGPGDPAATGSGPGPAVADSGPDDPAAGPAPGDPATGQGAGHSEFAGTVAGLGATEVERRGLTPAEIEAIVRAEIADRNAAADGYERAGQPEHAERLREEAAVLASVLGPG